MTVDHAGAGLHEQVESRERGATLERLDDRDAGHFVTDPGMRVPGDDAIHEARRELLRKGEELGIVATRSEVLRGVESLAPTAGMGEYENNIGAAASTVGSSGSVLSPCTLAWIVWRSPP